MLDADVFKDLATNTAVVLGGNFGSTGPAEIVFPPAEEVHQTGGMVHYASWFEGDRHFTISLSEAARGIEEYANKDAVIYGEAHKFREMIIALTEQHYPGGNVQFHDFDGGEREYTMIFLLTIEGKLFMLSFNSNKKS